MERQLQEVLALAEGGEQQEVQRLLKEHIVKAGNAGGLAWLLNDTPPAAQAVVNAALLNELLDVAATESASAGCVSVLLARGADPVAHRPTPTLLLVLNRLRFVVGATSSSRGCGSAHAHKQQQQQQQQREAGRLLAVVETLVAAMTPAQLNALDFRHFSALSFSAFYALDVPARWLLCAGADPFDTKPFRKHNAIEW